MGCLKLTYCENETPFLEEHSEKSEAGKLRVWVNPEREFLGVDVEEASQGDDPQNQHEWQSWGRLTDAEKDLATSHPSAAWAIYKNQVHAEEMARRLFPRNTLWNGAGDAFRHAYFNSLNARDVGIGLTIDFSYAHESGPGNDPTERIMDLNNNLKGMGVGQGQNLSNSEIMMQVYGLVKTGGLLMIENGNLVKTHWP